MSTRNFVPDDDSEGGIGKSTLRWLYGYFINLAVTTINKLTITEPTTSATLTIADGKTLTAEDDSVVDQDLTDDASPTHANLTLSDLSDGYVPYVSGTTFSDGSLQTDVADAVSKKHSNTLDHARQHSITSTSDHTSTATEGQLLKADSNGLPVDATNTDAEIAAAVTGSHDRQHSLISASDHTGTLSVAMGGTGLETLTDHSVLVGSGTSTITPIAVGATGEYLAGSTGADPAFATLNQAAVDGLKTTDSPVHVTVKLSGLTDGKIPYHVDDSTGLADGPTKTDVDDAVTKKHVAATVNSPLSISTQDISLVNNAGSPATVTTIDTDGTLAGNSDVYIPTQKAVKTYADTKLPITSLVLPFYDSDGNLDTIPLTADSKLPFYNAAGASKDIALTT